MVELKAKVTLAKKGDSAHISVKQLMCTLKWTKDVDLDLMVFYKAKDGRTGGVISDSYPGGSLGNLNSFPFIQLSGDAGVGAKGGENEEVVRITKLDDMLEIFICTLNYTDASEKKDVSFDAYDGSVTVMDDKGESIVIPLSAKEKGHVAVIARIDNSSPMGAKLVNENKIVDLGTFISTVPGANILAG